jgi:putative molybdopterin biosynthesis protein
LVLRTHELFDELLTPLWALLERADFQARVEALGGYSCAETGRRIR